MVRSLKHSIYLLVICANINAAEHSKTEQLTRLLADFEMAYTILTCNNDKSSAQLENIYNNFFETYRQIQSLQNAMDEVERKKNKERFGFVELAMDTCLPQKPYEEINNQEQE